MRFAVDAHAIGRRLTGNEVYAANLLRGLAALDEDDEYIAYVSVDQDTAWGRGRVRFRRVSANPFVRLGCEFGVKLRSDRPDLLHVQYTAPLACPVPVVVTVHDVSFLEHPEYFAPLRAAQLRWTVRRTIGAAARVLTVSEFSREAILRAYPGLDPGRVLVVPNAAAPVFRPVPRETAAAGVLRRFGIAAPFVFTVGDLQPRKNHLGLIAAFAELARRHPGLPHELVVAGKSTWYSGRIYQAARQSGVAERIRFTGFVSDAELVQLYNASHLVVFPSLYEGFGLPIVEAMACARAVACSNDSAVAEVADGAAILFDPRSPSELARAMADVLLDPDQRARLERLGAKRAAQFSWNRAARLTRDVYRDVAPPARRPTRVLSSPRAPR